MAKIIYEKNINNEMINIFLLMDYINKNIVLKINK